MVAGAASDARVVNDHVKSFGIFSGEVSPSVTCAPRTVTVQLSPFAKGVVCRSMNESAGPPVAVVAV